MKILEVLDCYYPKFDGPTQVVTNYCKSLQKKNGVEVETLVPFFPGYTDNQPFNVVRCKSMKAPEGYRAGLPGRDCKTKKHLKDMEYDIIHAHSPFTVARFAFKFGKKNNIPTVFTFHTKFKEDINRTVKFPLFRKIAMSYIMKTINMADYVLTVSNGAAECLREYGYKGEIKVIRNGTDLVKPEDNQKLIKEINEQYGLGSKEKVFLSVGRIVENKRIDFALDAMRIVADRGYKFKFIIVGAGPYEDNLKQKVKALQLDQNVIFTGKIMDREKLSAIYMRSDLFIFPSTFDTASLAPIEAAAMGVPTLMTLGCSTAEIITDEQNGMLAESDAEKWADKIQSIIEDDKKLKMLKQNAEKEVYRTWDSVVDEVYDFYEKIVNEEVK